MAITDEQAAVDQKLTRLTSAIRDLVDACEDFSPLQSDSTGTVNRLCADAMHEAGRFLQLSAARLGAGQPRGPRATNLRLVHGATDA